MTKLQKGRGVGSKSRGRGRTSTGQRRKTGQPQRVALVEFDPEARKEFVTGVRKRKNERRAKAQEEIKERERKERLQERKQRREASKQVLKSEKLKQPKIGIPGEDLEESSEEEFPREKTPPPDTIATSNFQGMATTTYVTYVNDDDADLLKPKADPSKATYNEEQKNGQEETSINSKPKSKKPKRKFNDSKKFRGGGTKKKRGGKK